MLVKAGFEKVAIKPNIVSREMIREWVPAVSENAADYVVSATIEAVKPV